MQSICYHERTVDKYTFGIVLYSGNCGRSRMSVAADERELLIGAKAVEEHIIASSVLTSAVARWTTGKSGSLLASLEADSALSDDQLKQLKDLFVSLEDSVAMEIADSIDDRFLEKLNGTLDDLSDDRLKETVTKWQSTGSLPLAAVSEHDRFEILSEHARGGLGEVLLAKDRQLNRQVALKRIREKWADHDSAKIRFQLEAEITGRLEHPGVVPVYALGQRDDGEVYYAMRFIRGQSLEEAAKEFHRTNGDHSIDMRSADFRNLLHRFVDVCNTMGYAHSRGIIHRDLKPANIMLGKYGETLVVDWGLAKQIGVKEDRMEDHGESCISSDLGSGSAPTQFGSAVGTPQYMSPEQATGRLDRMGPATDVFGLGATLYFILTGKAPQQDDTLHKVLNRVEHGDFARPSEHVSSIPRPLESVCLKAMSRNSAERYETASALAADVNSAVAGERVMAYAENRTERLRRWSRENRRLTRSILTALLLLLVGVSAFGTAVVLNRQSLLKQRVASIVSQANLKERLLSDGIEDLRQDIVLLSKRPQLAKQAKAFESGSITDVDRDILAVEFEAMLGLNPGYMQVRLIGSDGIEKVRVDRESLGGVPIRLSEDALQDKGGKAYFRDTRNLQAGDVYLSEINLNMEQGRHQWEMPTLRAAAPVFAQDDGRFLGAVVLNMHFAQISNALLPRDKNSELLVFLTDHDGRFLFCSDVPEVAFCFERGLSFPVESLYRQLGNFFASSSTNEYWNPNVSPRPTVCLSGHDESSTAVSRFADEFIAQATNVQVRLSRYTGQDVGTEMLIATGDQTSSLQMLLQTSGDGSKSENESVQKTQTAANFRSRELAHSFTNTNHALCARKIYFDPSSPKRYLCLILARPH